MCRSGEVVAQVDGVRDQVAEIEEVWRAFVRHHGNVLPHGQPRGEHVLTRGRGVAP
jgi:hypothetical protein